MAVDKKISQLTSLAQVDVSASTDVLPIVDTSATETKKITVSALVGAGATAGISGAVLTNGTINSTTIGATTPSTGAFTTLSASGNLTFSSTAQRITGDMSNATIANRLAFQTSTTNGNTDLQIIPNGTSVTSGIRLNNNSDTTNAGYVRMSLNSSEATVSVDRNSVSGTYLPLLFNTGGSERMRLDTSGNLGIGATPSYRLDVQGGTASFTGSSGANAIRVAGAGGSWFWIDNPTTTTMRFSSGATAGTGAMVLDSSGNVGIGTASPVTRLHVLDALSGGQLIVANSETNAAEKYGTFATQHYTNAQSPALGMAVQSNSTDNNILIGGALGEFNAATTVRFYTAANNTTTTGSERMRIDSSGNVGIGGTAGADTKLNITGTLPSSGTVSRTLFTNVTVPSGTTAEANGFQTSIATQAASFTLGSLYHFHAVQSAIGAGSAVTNQYGFAVNSGLTGATNNYGFYSNIASGSNRWNFYAAGTADNYFAGNVGVASTGLTNVRFRVKGSGTGSADYTIYGENSAATLLFYVRNDGVFNTGLAANSPYNLTTASAANCFINSDGALYRSTSSLRYKSDVADAAHGLADVLKLRSVTYKAKNDGDTVFGGLIAEEVHDAGLTEFVAYDKEGRPDALHYGNMVALLVKAVQELKAELEALKAA